MQPPGWQDAAPDRTPSAAPTRAESRDGPGFWGELPEQTVGRYEDFLRASVDWVWETDAGLLLDYVSAPVAARLGIPAQMLTGRPLADLGRFEAGQGRDRDAAAAIAARRPFRNAPYRMTGTDQREVPFRLSGVPFYDDETGEFAGYRGTAVYAEDLAPEAAAAQSAPFAAPDEELSALASILEEALLRYQDAAWRLANAKDSDVRAQAEPLRRTAHELRTPLNAIIGYADLALNGVFGPLDERYADCFRTIREAGRHLDGLVAQLQPRAPDDRSQPIKHETVDVAGIVAKAKAMVALAARNANVSIARVGPVAGGRVVGDPVALMQILVNLLSNAVKFTPSGGAIGLETFAGPDNRLHIAVWDTGVGIAEAEQQKIFEQDYRAAQGGALNQVPGLGLGLAISRELARRMGGDITVVSQPGQGSRFTLSLPQAPESA
jgi:signal transduction histidine kinase